LWGPYSSFTVLQTRLPLADPHKKNRLHQVVVQAVCLLEKPVRRPIYAVGQRPD
jgi:hypothetical protein